jgi:heptosyltransferase-1
LSRVRRILAVRLGAMGDIICALPAVASLKHGIAGSSVTWVIERKWTPLLEANPYVDHIIAIDRASAGGLMAAWRQLRSERFDLAVDFQGLLKSALVAASARPERIWGFDRTRERMAAWFYSNRVTPRSVHEVDKNLELAEAIEPASLIRQFPIPPGRPEGVLPREPFVLASPLAGWGAKQWPLESYAILGRMLEREFGLKLVLNAPRPVGVEHTEAHVSGLPGLIHATRRAVAVVGLDSGPLHLAAALGKPGVGIYGPSDPARTGPYGGTITVLRTAGAFTTYRREQEISEDMRAISAEMVMDALRPELAARKLGEPA